MTTDQEHKELEKGTAIKNVYNVDLDAHIAFLLDEKAGKMLRVSQKTNLLLADGSIVQAGEFYWQFQEYSKRFWPRLKSSAKGGSIRIEDMNKVEEKNTFQSLETDSHNLIAS